MCTRHGILSAAGPAWPTLIGVQVVVLAMLAGTAWRAGLAPLTAPGPLEARVLDLDPAVEGAAVEQALARQRRIARALNAADQTRTQTFLSLTAAAADLELVGAEWTVGPDAADPMVVDADVRLELSGDAFDLPAFLDGLHRQAALTRVRAVAVSVAPGGAARAWVSLRYHRPVVDDPTRNVGDLVARVVPAATDDGRRLLADAARLARWRRFAGTVDARGAVSEQVRARLLRELPAALVAVAMTGGVVRWSATDGAEAAPNPAGR